MLLQGKQELLLSQLEVSSDSMLITLWVTQVYVLVSSSSHPDPPLLARPSLQLIDSSSLTVLLGLHDTRLPSCELRRSRNWLYLVQDLGMVPQLQPDHWPGIRF